MKKVDNKPYIDIIYKICIVLLFNVSDNVNILIEWILWIVVILKYGIWLYCIFDMLKSLKSALIYDKITKKCFDQMDFVILPICFRILLN